MDDLLFLDLKNAQIIKFDSDNYAYGGCPTCDYGSEYVNEFSILTTNYIIDCKVKDMYEYPLNMSFFIKFFCQNIELFKEQTEEEFIEFLKNEIDKLHKEKRMEYDYEFKVKRN